MITIIVVMIMIMVPLASPPVERPAGGSREPERPVGGRARAPSIAVMHSRVE